MPTDIDGFFEYHNKAFVFMEYKYRDASLSTGQKIAYERLVDVIQNAGKCAVLLLCRHNVKDTYEIVDSSKSIVSDMYYKGKWRENINKSVKEVEDDIIRFAEKSA